MSTFAPEPVDDFGPIDRNFAAIATALNALGFYWGTGDPNGQVTASVGAVFRRQDGGTGTTLWIKESGTNTNSGWVGK